LPYSPGPSQEADEEPPTHLQSENEEKKRKEKIRIHDASTVIIKQNIRCILNRVLSRRE
jgi:hypothetical protein